MPRTLVAIALLAVLAGCGKIPSPPNDSAEPARPVTTVAQKQCVEGVYYYGLWYGGTEFVPHSPAYTVEGKVQTCTSDK